MSTHRHIEPAKHHTVSRRGFLAASAATGVGGMAVSACASPQHDDGQDQHDDAWLADQQVPFDGVHQAGVQTPSQAHVNLLAFNFHEGVDRAGIKRLMRLWTEDARALCTGNTPVGSLEPELTTSPANLTITCGFGPRLFDVAGLTKQRPSWLAPIPAFAHDKLDPQWGQSDLVLQICGDDPLGVAHAMRHMIRSGKEYVTTGWLQQGFLHADGVGRGQTARNLFGQKDGTVNPHTDEEFAQQVWIDQGPAWARGGTAMVVRRIFMNQDTWEILDRPSREVVVGRDLVHGAPLSGGDEFTPADFQAADASGLTLIDPNSHMARATPPAGHPEQRILRRPFNWDIQPDPATGATSNTGQIFICFQKDPTRQFIPIQRRLDQADRLNEWITHIGSAVYFVTPGVSASDPGRDAYWGAGLLEG